MFSTPLAAALARVSSSARLLTSTATTRAWGARRAMAIATTPCPQPRSRRVALGEGEDAPVGPQLDALVREADGHHPRPRRDRRFSAEVVLGRGLAIRHRAGEGQGGREGSEKLRATAAARLR